MKRTAPVRGKLVLGFLALSVLSAGGAAMTLATSDDRPAAPCRLDRAKIALVDRDYAKVEELLKGETSREALLLLGRAFLERGRIAEARKLFTDLLKESPSSWEAARGMGLACERAGQLDLAVVYLARAAELKPDDAQLHRELGLAYHKKSDHMAALASLDRSLEIDGRQEDLPALISEIVSGRNAWGDPAGMAKPGAPGRPGPIDPRDLVPKPPDPTRHFPAPGRTR